MKHYEEIADWIRQNPGSSLRQIAAGMGSDIYHISANMKQALHHKLVRREGKPFVYYPVEGGKQ